MAVTVNQSGGIIYATANADTWVEKLYVKSWRWVDATTADHDLVVTDPVSGENLIEAVAVGADYTEGQLVERWWNNGFTVTTIDSGTLYVQYQ